MAENCEKCKFRAHYDKKPNSLLGRFWLIEGWIIAIQQMHIGDKWELYIPAEMGYGKFSQPGIPGGSALIFEIELLGIA